MNKVRVTICGKEYALKTEESASYFYALAKKVEKEIDGMVAQHRRKELGRLHR